MTDKAKAQEIYNKIYKQCIEEGYHKKIATTYAIMGKVGAEIMAEWKEKHMIEKSCEWMKEHVEDFMPPTYSFHEYPTGELIYFFKNAMIHELKKGGEE